MIVSEEELFMVEDAYEQSFQQIISRDGVQNAYRSRQGLEMETPCVEIKFLPGQVTEGYRHQIRPGLAAYAAWKGSVLQFTIKTNRGSENAFQHKIYLAKIRKNCQMYNLLTTWTATQGTRAHAIADIREQGSQHSVDNDNNIDVTVISFWVMHNLKDSAWPTNI